MPKRQFRTQLPSWVNPPCVATDEVILTPEEHERWREMLGEPRARVKDSRGAHE